LWNGRLPVSLNLGKKMNKHELKLSVLPQSLAICRLDRKESIPPWATEDSRFTSVTVTSDEISIVCPESVLPPEAKANRSWRALRVEGNLDLSMTGVIASLTSPLADAGISVFTLSTYDTDYLLVKSEKSRGCEKSARRFLPSRDLRPDMLPHLWVRVPSSDHRLQPLVPLSYFRPCDGRVPRR